MPATLEATLDEERYAVRLEVDAIPSEATAYTISRTAPSGNAAIVRGHSGKPVETATVIARDYEAPLDLELVYTVTLTDQGGAPVETVTATFRLDWQACEAWLCDLARPTNSLALTVESLHELAYNAPAGVHRVLGRRAPVLTTLPAWTPSTELIVLTGTLGERDQCRALLGNGYPVLLRTGPEQGIGNLYLGVTGFVEERFLTLGTAPERRFRVQGVQVERPDPTIFVPIPPNTYANSAELYPTYADRTAAGTYDDVSYTYPDDPDAQPIVPWLPDDV
jgi:hypothetical protein